MKANAAARWELDALSRLARARDLADAIVCGHLPADPDVVDAAARLTASAAVALRRRDACEGRAA